MNENRSRRISLVFQARAGWKAWEMAEALDALPHDAEIVGFDRNYAEDTTLLAITSSRFPEVSEGGIAVCVIACFQRDSDGDVEFSSFQYVKTGEPFTFDRRDAALDIETDGVDLSSVKHGLLMFGTPSGKNHWLYNHFKDCDKEKFRIDLSAVQDRIFNSMAIQPADLAKFSPTYQREVLGVWDNDGGAAYGPDQAPNAHRLGIASLPTSLKLTEDCNCAYEGYKFHTRDCPAKKQGPCK